METVYAFRLRSPRSDNYVCGFASIMEISEGRILLKDRRIPWAKFHEGYPVEFAHHLGDLEIPADDSHGWAAWGVKEPLPEWWNRSAGAATVPAVISSETLGAA